MNYFLPPISTSWRLYIAVAGMMILASLWSVEQCLLPLLLRAITNSTHNHGSMLLMIFLVASIANHGCYQYLYRQALISVKYQVNQQIFTQLLQKSGEMSAQFVQDIESHWTALLQTIIECLVPQMMMICGVLISSQWIHPQFTVVMMIAVVLMLVDNYWSLCTLPRATRALIRSKIEVQAQQRDSLRCKYLSQQYHQCPQEAAYHQQALLWLQSRECQLLRPLHQHKLIQKIIAAVMLGTLLTVGYGLIDQQQISHTDLLCMLWLAQSLLQPFMGMSDTLVQCCNKAHALHVLLSVAMRSSASQPHSNRSSHRICTIKSAEPIKIDHLTVQHPQGKLLQSLSLEIKSGERIGILGTSGSGKTTLAKCLTGDIIPDSGTIKGIGRVCYLHHLQSLPKRRIVDIIRYGQPKADFQAVVSTAKLMGCHAMICALPQQYDTVYHSGLFSSGQTQRLLCAQAYLYSPDLLILDEVTAHLDSRCEGRLLHALIRSDIPAVMVISHKMETFQWLPTCYELKAGRLHRM